MLSRQRRGIGDKRSIFGEGIKKGFQVGGGGGGAERRKLSCVCILYFHGKPIIGPHSATALVATVRS